MRKLVIPAVKSYPIGAQFVSNSSTSLPAKMSCAKTAVNNLEKKKKKMTISSSRRMASSVLGAEPASDHSTSATIANRSLIGATISPPKARKRKSQGESERGVNKKPKMMRKRTSTIMENGEATRMILMNQNLLLQMMTNLKAKRRKTVHRTMKAKVLPKPINAAESISDHRPKFAGNCICNKAIQQQAATPDVIEPVVVLQVPIDPSQVKGIKKQGIKKQANKSHKKKTPTPIDASTTKDDSAIPINPTTTKDDKMHDVNLEIASTI